MLLMNALPEPPPFAIATAVGAVGVTTSFVLVDVAEPEVFPAWSVAVAVAVTVPSFTAVALMAEIAVGLVAPRAVDPVAGVPPPELVNVTETVSVAVFAPLVGHATL